MTSLGLGISLTGPKITGPGATGADWQYTKPSGYSEVYTDGITTTCFIAIKPGSNYPNFDQPIPLFLNPNSEYLATYELVDLQIDVYGSHVLHLTGDVGVSYEGGVFLYSNLYSGASGPDAEITGNFAYVDIQPNSHEGWLYINDPNYVPYPSVSFPISTGGDGGYLYISGYLPADTIPYYALLIITLVKIV